MRISALHFCSTLLLAVLSKSLAAPAAACGDGCLIPLSSTSFTGDSLEQDYEAMMCTNLLRVQSVYLCMRDNCTPRQIKASLKSFSSDCMQYGGYSLLPWSVLDNVTNADEQTFPIIEYENTTWGGSVDPVVYDTPVVLGESILVPAIDTASAWEESEITRANYAYAMYGFWGIVLIIGMVNRLYTFVSQKLQLKSNTSATLSSSSLLRCVKLNVRKHITTPALVGTHTAQAWGWCTIPPRLQSLTLIAFLIINIVLCCVSYNAFDGNLYWASKSTQIWRYLSDRTGCIAMANMPLIWAFATRNNVLIWLTGWDFATFNQFHRWVARIATIEAVIHSVGYTVEVFQEGGRTEYLTEFAERYWWMGVIATITMSLLCGASIYPIRKFFYEVFLLVHIILAVLFLVGMYYHIEIFEGEYNPYIWPCVAVWAFDRFLRIARLLSNNVGTGKGTVAYNTDSNLLRLNVPIRSTFKPAPGSHYYVYILSGLRLWESHPFTVSSWSELKPDKGGVSSGRTLSFAIRPYDSFTSRLRTLALQSKDAECSDAHAKTGSVSVIVEGPYGASHNLKHFETVMFLVGGSGITVALGYVRALYDDIKNGHTCNIRSVRLVWAVKDRAMFDEVFEQEITNFWLGSNGVASKIDVTIDLYITRSSRLEAKGRGSLSDSLSRKVEVVGDKNLALDKSSLVSNSDSEIVAPGLTVSTERPDVREIIVESSLVNATSGRKMAVVCCGPASMADDGRAGVVAALGKGCDGLEYFPESFTW